MADYKYETWALTEIAARVVADIIEHGASTRWRCYDKPFREVVRKKLQEFNLKLEISCDDSDTWRLNA